MTKLELCHVDTCFPDYWSGHHRAHLQIPVYKGMTLKAIKQALKDEIRQGAVAGNERLAYLLSSDMVRPEEEKDADTATRAAYAAINRMKPEKMRRIKKYRAPRVIPVLSLVYCLPVGCIHLYHGQYFVGLSVILVGVMISAYFKS